MQARLKTRLAAAPAAVVLTAGLIVTAPPAHAVEAIGPDFAADYSLTDLGSPPGVPTNLGGLTLKAGDPDTLLIGGNANGASGAIYEIGVTRDADGHIDGYDGVATKLADAPGIDGGLAYAPNGTLFYTAFPSNVLGQVLPGASTVAKSIDLGAEGIIPSVGTLQFVPASHPGAGRFKIASYSSGGFYDVDLSDAGDGTYDIDASALENTPGGGPEGIAYVPIGSQAFPAPSLLLSKYSTGQVSAYETDAEGNPVLATERPFITGLGNVLGAHIDSQTNDFLFSTYGAGNRVIVVKGFDVPTCRNMQTSAGVTTSYDPVRKVTTFTGTEGDDVIAGTRGKDVIEGLGGNDLICGGRGADVINGGEGNDTVSGQKGVDKVHGDGGNDNVIGGAGADTLTGGNGIDALNGGPADDTCDGGTDTNRFKNCESVIGSD